MAKFKTVLTTAGAAKIAAVLAGTASIVLDNTAKMAVGDGGGTLPTPNPAQTKLVNEVHRAPINRASIDTSDPKNIVAELVIPPDTGGFWIREMALYDAAGTLLAVGNMAETYKPSLSEGAGRKMVIRMVIAVSEVNAITITMDTSTVMATQDYVDSEIDKHAKSRNHPDATLTAKGFTQLSSSTTSSSETLSATPKAVKAAMDEAKLKAPLASPALTGTPTAPTPAQTVNNTQIATTAYVKSALTALINSSPDVLDTLGELAAALGNDANFATTVANSLALKAPLASPALTGTPTAPTAAAGTSTTQLSTTAFVQAAIAVLQTAINSALALKAPLASPALTGTPTAPTAAQTVNNTQIATTAYVKAAVSALVNASPSALDTLKELADALGNDANFAATMTNALAGKQPLNTTLTNISGKSGAEIMQYIGVYNLINPTSPGQTVVYTPDKSKCLVLKEDGSWGFIATDSGEAVPLPVAYGGTGAKEAEKARDNLGVTDELNKKQDANENLAALAGVSAAANKLPYFTGKNAMGVADLSSFIRAMLGKADAPAVLSYLGMGDGTGRLLRCQVFKASGTYTPTPGTKFAIVEAVGGGGAGGGCQVGTPENAACGGGGMSGEYVKARIDNPATTTVTIGYGGLGASANPGAPGGNTSFGTGILAKGGLGGNILPEGADVAIVGPTGAYTPEFAGANILGSGSGYTMPGTRYSGILALGGPGGSSVLGEGAGAQAVVGEGFDARGHGGGGGGACVYGGATQQRAGGAGMAGIVLVWEYA